MTSTEALAGELQLVWQRMAMLEKRISELERRLADRDSDRRDVHQSRP